MSLLNKIKLWLKKIFNIKDDTTNTTTTNTTTIIPTDWKTLAKQEEASRNFSLSGEITYELKLNSISKSKVTFTDQKKDWEAKDGLIGEAHLYMIRNNEWKGGKFDHIRNPCGERDFKNVNGGYGVFGTLGAPQNGETVAFVFVKYSKTQRTNAVFTKWVS